MIGRRLAHYEITAAIGEGGMGAVYRATDTKLHREVAIKVLPDEFAADPDRMARFTREAQVLASLNHPNIATIYGVEDRAIVMELVEGADLRGPLPLDTALNYAGQIADALEAAHEKGITHRDLKPANIKVTPQGVVKVLDFGLAKIGAATPDPNATTRTSTQPGLVMGTAGYMAPEQARGQVVDKRADIWAFGVVLWEMLTGKQLFGGATGSDAIASVLTREPDLGAVPAKVRRLLASCLEKDPRKRLRDISAWRYLLQEEPPPSRSSSKLSSMIAAGLLTVGFAIVLWRAPGTPAATTRPLVQLDLDVGDDVSYPAISSDGQRLAFVTKNQLAVRRLDQSKITFYPGTEGATSPFFSPDGEWIAFFAGGKLKKISWDGVSSVTLCDAPSAGSGSWGEDGNIIARLQLGALSKLSAAGGPPQPFTDLKREPAGTTGHMFPQVLPAGKGVLYESFGRGTLAHTSAAGGWRESQDSGGERFASTVHLEWPLDLLAARNCVRRSVRCGPARDYGSSCSAGRRSRVRESNARLRCVLLRHSGVPRRIKRSESCRLLARLVGQDDADPRQAGRLPIASPFARRQTAGVRDREERAVDLRLRAGYAGARSAGFRPA